MPCDVFHHDGATFIVCSRKRRKPPPLCCVCKRRPATLLCDAPVADRPSGTCDRPLCEKCTSRSNVRHLDGETFDLCPRHASEGHHLGLWEGKP